MGTKTRTNLAAGALGGHPVVMVPLKATPSVGVLVLADKLLPGLYRVYRTLSRHVLFVSLYVRRTCYGGREWVVIYSSTSLSENHRQLSNLHVQLTAGFS